MEAHEVLKWESDTVEARLNGSSGTSIKLSPAHLRLTNQYIRVSTRHHTYTVAGRGDRNFTEVRIPLLAAKPHRFIQPWFGPYKWETAVQAPLSIEPADDQWTLTLTFSSGGAFEYRTAFLKAFGEASQAASEGIDEVLPAYEP